MANYKGIQGYMVESLASDPGTLSEVIGKLWYNSGSNVWKVAKEASGAWSSGGNLNTARNTLSGFGDSNTAAISVGGHLGTPGDSYTGATESYDGTTWTTVTSTSPTRGEATACGSQTAGLFFAGVNQPGRKKQTQSWNGTGWTELADQSDGHGGGAGFGTQTAAIIASGVDAVAAQVDAETWDGSTWTETGDVNNARAYFTGTGIQTAGILMGGVKAGPALSNAAETYDGSTWTEVTVINTARRDSTRAGLQNTAMMVSGNVTPSATAIVEQYNGTGWTEIADVTSPQKILGGDGTSSSAFKSGGGNPSVTNISEEWNDPVYAAVTVTTS